MKSINRFFTALKDGFRLTPPGIDRLLVDCRSGDSDRQYQAMLALSEYYPDSAARPLVGLLTSTAHAVRTRATTLLGDLGGNDLVIVGPALTNMLNDPEYLVRAEAAKSLGRLGYFAARNQIARLLHTDPKWAARGAAAEALGYFADAASLADLEQALQETTPAVRAGVVRSLGVVADPTFASVLQALLATETTPAVKREFLAATYRLGEGANLYPLLSMLDTAPDTDEAMNTMQTIQYLVTYRPPASLRDDKAAIWEAVIRATTRFSLLSSQAKDIEDALAKIPAVVY